MDLQALLERAFHTAPATDANTEIARVREEQGGGGLEALSYEAVLPPGESLEQLADRLLPRLVYFLDCRKGGVANAHGVFVSLFHKERLYFLHARDVIELCAAQKGFDLEELVKRYGAMSV
jgi:hypothetical protein